MSSPFIPDTLYRGRPKSQRQGVLLDEQYIRGPNIDPGFIRQPPLVSDPGFYMNAPVVNDPGFYIPPNTLGRKKGL